MACGLEPHDLRQMSADDLHRGNPLPEIVAHRKEFSEHARMAKMHEVRGSA